MQAMLKQLYAYNDTANRRFIETFLAVQPTAERISSVFSHILNAHRIWIARIGGSTPAGGTFGVIPVEQWASVNTENLGQTMQILEAQDLGRLVDYRDLKGNPHQSRLHDILFHVINHSTYHRGQLAILLGQESKTPPVTDYIVYAREQSAQAGGS